MVGYLYLFILNSAFPTEDTTSERGGGVYQLLPWDAKNTFPSGETRDTKQKENSEDEIVRKLLACYSFKWVYVEWIKLVVFGFLRVYKFLFFLEVIPPQSNVLNIYKTKIEVSNYAKSNETYISYLCETCHYSPFCNSL